MTDWQTLTDAIARVVALMPDRGAVQLVEIARPDEGRRIHVARRGNRLWATASARTPLSDEELPIRGDQLAGYGWSAPDHRRPFHWWLELELPTGADHASFAALAARLVGAIYYGFGIGSPDQLAYRAWQDGGPESLEYPQLALPRAEVRYYALVGPGQTHRRPGGLLRRTWIGDRVTDEEFGRQLRWVPAASSITDPGSGRNAVAVDREAALALTEQWRQSGGPTTGHPPAEQTVPPEGYARERGGLRLPQPVAGVDARGELIPAPTRLADDERDRVVEYLLRAPRIVSAFGFAADPYLPNRPEVIPTNLHTDGEWLWSESLAYYARNYGFAPDPEFLDHIRRAGYRWPELSHEALTQLSKRLRGQ